MKISSLSTVLDYFTKLVFLNRFICIFYNNNFLYFSLKFECPLWFSCISLLEWLKKSRHDDYIAISRSPYFLRLQIVCLSTFNTSVLIDVEKLVIKVKICYSPFLNKVNISCKNGPYGFSWCLFSLHYSIQIVFHGIT